MIKLGCRQSSISAESEAFSKCGWSSKEACGQTPQEGSGETRLKEVKKGASGPAVTGHRRARADRQLLRQSGWELREINVTKLDLTRNFMNSAPFWLEKTEEL